MTARMPSGGDDCRHPCPECNSVNTVYTEYAYKGDITELGFECEESNHQVDPDEYREYYED